MPFLENDLYLAQGDDKLVRGDWTSTVYKYDASSFYNWEQDNLPLYDLEERTEFNWEQLGYPTSSLTGLHLSVSDSSVDATGPYQVFSSVSAALNKLPRTLRFPVIIEVAVSGNLGNIDIQDFEFVGDGGLEIVNRGFAKILSGSGAGTVWDTSAAGATSSITSLSSIDLSSTMGNTSSLATATNVTTVHGNNFWNNWHRSFIRMADVFSIAAITFEDYGYGSRDAPKTPTPDYRNNGITATIKNTSPGFFSNTNSVFSFSDYTDSTYAYDYNGSLMGSFTSKALRPSNMANLQAATDRATRIKALPTGFVYANSAQRITVKNCNGPLYIRGFVVDGNLATVAIEPAQDHGVANGIEIENSNVLLENCAVMRCAETGLKITNSKVNLNRGFTSYRVYPLAANTRGSSTAYGMQANNSEITLSGAYDVSSGLPSDSPFSFAHSPVGVQLNNSILKTPEGGRGKDLKGASVVGAQTPYNQLYLDTFLNTEVGLEANDSTIDFNHTLMSYMNEVGIRLNNTTLKVSEIVCDHNNWCGLEGKNSTVEYYKTLHGLGNSLVSPNKALDFLFNGQHLDLENCVFKNKKFKLFDIDRHIYPFEIGSGGYRVRDGVTIPGVHLKNTKADFMQMRTLAGNASYSFTATEPVLGEAYYIDEGSNVKFMGCSGDTYCTRIEGDDSSYDALLDSTPIYVDNGSKVEFNGPTVLGRAGINVGANNNSIIKFAPHNTEGKLDVSSYALSDTNQHTRVEMQSFKSCLVADNGSTIEMKDCGDFNRLWAKSPDSYVTKATSGLIAASDYNASDANGTSLYTSGGYIQFYPNPITRGITDVTDPTALSYLVSTLDPIGGLDTSNTPTFDPTEYSKYSWGGMCVRANKGSEVKVLNTHFPCGWQNASSVTLDVSAGVPATTTCGKLYIWNIGDDSRLHMSHISVSGNYPGDTGYYGPSGLYVSSVVGCGGAHVALSAAPSATPNTGRLSVLDSYGMRPAIAADTATGVSAIEARTSFANKGPFRIYFSVDPMAHFLGYTRGGTAGFAGAYQSSSNLDAGYSWDYPPSAVEIGEPLQELAQGYNPSRDCSTPDPTTVSAIYNQLGFQTAAAAGGEPLSTTFFYASGMLDESYVSRIWLDDSAMNTFANAKNATKGTSGRPKLVSYYRAVNAKYGSSYTGDFGNTDGWRNGYGLGFRSPNIFDFNKDT
jgi:hypothetical protein